MGEGKRTDKATRIEELAAEALAAGATPTLAGISADLVRKYRGVYDTRIETLRSLRKLTDYEDGYNLYGMDVSYDYSLDRIIGRGLADTQAAFDAIAAEALPLIPLHIKVPSFGCTAFVMRDEGGDVHMGRNYDFFYDTSAMVVHCRPRDGYASVGLAALDNASANDPEASLAQGMASLTSPFICLDGLNERGVSIAVLTEDAEPACQDTGKPTIATTIAIRLVLDRAASTEEAVRLLRGFDMRASSGRDYHLYIVDASGDARIVEYDCDDEARPMVVTSTDVVTNFFVMYEDRVLPHQKNGAYGHGRERYDMVREILGAESSHTSATVWRALRACAQKPTPGDVTSNTQWSLDYDNTRGTVGMVLRRHWGDVIDCEV